MGNVWNRSSKKDNMNFVNHHGGHHHGRHDDNYKGLSGIMDPVETGLACGSDTGKLFKNNLFIFL